MKNKISITLDKEMIELIDSLVEKQNGIFRNRSHFVEYSLRKMMDESKSGERLGEGK